MIHDIKELDVSKTGIKERVINEIITLAKKHGIKNEFIISEIIDKFYIQFELAWKVLKELKQYDPFIR